MNVEGVVIFDSKSGVPLFSKLEKGIDPSLFSSFITAARHFSSELSLGGLSSFTTEEKVIFLAARGKTITALITPKSQEFQETYELACELGDQFENRFEVNDKPSSKEYMSFSPIVNEVLKKVENPFLRRVADFVYEEYGGEIWINPRLMRRNGADVEGLIDIVLRKTGKEREDRKDMSLESLSELLSKNFIFVKAIDGVAGRSNIMDFVDSVSSFGSRVWVKGKLEFIPYLPSNAVVVARTFSDGAYEYIERLPSSNDIIRIDGTHAFVGSTLKKIPKETTCKLDLWRWRDSAFPERVTPNGHPTGRND
jgi:hypothetical protein